MPLDLLPAALLARGQGGARVAVEAYRDALCDSAWVGASGRAASNGHVNVAVGALQAVARVQTLLDRYFYVVVDMAGKVVAGVAAHV